MKRESIEQQPSAYDERLIGIDEKICALILQRKEISGNKPGTPPKEQTSIWAEKYGLYEDLLDSVFGLLRSEEFFRPKVEPIEFLKHLPVMKSIEIDNHFYSVTYIRQFKNASVVNLSIDWDASNDPNDMIHRRHHQEVMHLEIKGHDCMPIGGGGSDGRIVSKFVVSPPLPDNLKEICLSFREYNNHFKEHPTGLEFDFYLE